MTRPIEFTELKPKIWQTLHATYESLPTASTTPSQVDDALAADLAQFGFSDSDALRIAGAFRRSFDSIREAIAECGPEASSAPDYESAASPSGKRRLILSIQDVSCMKAILADEPSYDARRLLVAFAAWDRANYHHSGWIRYDRQAIMCLAGLANLRPREQEALTQLLHREYGLDMQVVGSNSPIPCFRLSWLEEEPPIGGPSNEARDLGALSPAMVAYATCEALGLPPSPKQAQQPTKKKGKKKDENENKDKEAERP